MVIYWTSRDFSNQMIYSRYLPIRYYDSSDIDYESGQMLVMILFQLLVVDSMLQHSITLELLRVLIIQIITSAI